MRVLYPHKTIWCYTGNSYEKELLQPSPARCEVTDEMLGLIDVLVDGEFLTEEKDITLRFRGSGNQRIIDMNRTRTAGHTVLWQTTRSLRTTRCSIPRGPNRTPLFRRWQKKGRLTLSAHGRAPQRARPLSFCAPSPASQARCSVSSARFSMRET